MTEWFCIACARHHANQAPAVEKQLLPSGVMLRACDRLLEPYADTIREHMARELARRAPTPAPSPPPATVSRKEAATP